MKYYQFNRKRNSDPLRKFWGSNRKNAYLLRTGRSRVLESGYTDSETYGALYKCWLGYTIAKNKGELEKQIHYAKVIQKLQHEIGLPISDFPEVWVFAEDFIVDDIYNYDKRTKNGDFINQQ